MIFSQVISTEQYMKTHRYIGLLLIAFLALLALPAHAGWVDDFKTSAVGAYRQAGFTHGPSQLGAGVAAEAPFNKYVSGQVRLLAFEGEDQSWGGGSVIDEISVAAKSTFLSSANKKFNLGGRGGIDRDQQNEDWGFDLGLWLNWQPTKRLGFELGRELSAWFNQDRSWLTTASVSWTW